MQSIRRIFVSYDYTRDRQLRNAFVAQAKRRRLPVVLEDFSLEENHEDPDWEAKAKQRIRRCHLIVVLIGQDTHSAAGVRKEVDIGRGFQVPVIQVRSNASRKAGFGKVRGAGEEYPWRWKVLDVALVEPGG